MPDESIEIRVKPVKTKAEKARLPGAVPRGYPSKVLVVFVDAITLESLCGYAESELDYELGGVLVGRVGKASRKTFVQVTGFIPAEKGISHRASFEFTNEAQKAIHEQLLERFPDRRIVGWFHTHPGYGVFLSSADQFIDEHYFRENFHIAAVIDPRSKDTGIFVWDKEGRRVRIPFLTSE